MEKFKCLTVAPHCQSLSLPPLSLWRQGGHWRHAADVPPLPHAPCRSTLVVKETTDGALALPTCSLPALSLPLLLLALRP